MQVYFLSGSNSFSNTDRAVRGRFCGAGVTLGEVRKKKSAGGAKAGAEDGGEGARS